VPRPEGEDRDERSARCWRDRNLTGIDAARIRIAALHLADEPGDLAEPAAALVTAFPAGLVRVLHRYAGSGSANNTLLLRGLLGDVADLPPSPGTTTPPALGAAVDAAAHRTTKYPGGRRRQPTVPHGTRGGWDGRGPRRPARWPRRPRSEW
jgi:hypothetical protein